MLDHSNLTSDLTLKLRYCTIVIYKCIFEIQHKKMFKLNLS